eukprot:CAMPEP_0167758832 /NCGR_PEP_ID=MMETSP0110_2-20121227/10689_1 /TAXON_ID=629695 /ORGANISM="Gymnochlora sp., Strain CCMP2014" /LENGTH=371 /DNA_ID=CAMNT_0007645155 /DNA_START=50 /DNA_END=1166 /DNA_ORIENTATION=+
MAEKRLEKLDPNSSLLKKFKGETREETKEAHEDIEKWIESSKKKDENIIKLEESGQGYVPSSLPPVRGTVSDSKRKRTRAKPAKASAKDDIWGPEDKGVAQTSEQSSGGSSISMEQLKSKAENYRLRGNEEFRSKQFDAAIRMYTLSIEAYPSVAALTNRALMNLKLNRHKAAEEDCTQALSKNPDGNFKAFLRRGLARMELEAYQNAVKDLECALKVAPDSKKQKAKVESHLKQAEQKRDKARKLAEERKKAAARNVDKPTPTMRRLNVIEDDDEDSEDDDDEEVVPINRKRQIVQVPEEKVLPKENVVPEGKILPKEEKIISEKKIKIEEVKVEEKLSSELEKALEEALKSKEEASAQYKLSKYSEISV